VVAADGDGSAQRMSSLLLDRGLSFSPDGPACRPHQAGRLHRSGAAASAAAWCPGQAGGGGRGRPHRPPPSAPGAPPRKRQGAGLFDGPQARQLRRAPPARRGPLRGMVKRAIGGVERDYLLLRVPGRRQAVRPQRPDRRGPSLHRRRHPAVALGGGDFAKTKAKVRSRGPARSPRSWWCSTRSGCTPPATPSARTPRGSARWRAFPYRRDARPAARPSTTSRPTWSERSRWTASCAATSASARPRWRCAPRSRPCRTASRWRARAHHAAGHQHFQTFAERFAGLPGARRGAVALPHRRRTRRRRSRRPRLRRGRRRHRHPPAAVRRTSRSRTSGCSWSTRSSASASATRRRSRS
jgi:hypothetical protein